MARMKYLSRLDVDPVDPTLFDRLEKERPVPTANLFRVLAHAPHLLHPFLSYATALRRQTRLDPLLRELAILVVGMVTHCDYAVVHHRKHALTAGLSEQQFQSIATYDASSLFDTDQKAIMRFAEELTRDAAVCDETWAAAKRFLDDGQMIELLLTIGWYNSAVRVMGAVAIEIEPGRH